MVKILILANNSVGLYKFRKELIEKLTKENEVYISLPDGDYISKLKEFNCKFINTPISRRGTNPISDIKLLMSYNRIINEIKPEIILTYTIKPNVYGGIAARISKVPYIANITGLGTAVENNGILQKITLFLYKLALKNAKCVFFQNKGNAEFMKSKIVINNYRLIPGSGVNLKEYSVMEYPSDKTIKFLFIARIMKEKGIEQYLEAAEYFNEKHSNIEFHILGYCEELYADKLKDMHDIGIINYHGMQDNVIDFHKTSHCTIHPTYYPEGMSNVLLETAACGRPVITTNRSGCREIVEHMKTGYIVEQKNTRDLISKIENFIGLENKAKRQMGLDGRKKVEKEFDRNIIVNAYIEEIEKALR
ncbi:glycosyltransferase family 4 protein [Paenisporosarcina quisquiliarum]|uniref:Glycosyltransferase family 4 protein n=1 Tax=Paenisporosarcina quisquiliarum TaxID=365346 RepID=A0A9X3LGF8_9BACL|nr:glycosyltransferase family 4 protein [Paenisporosarcina quisquiliarum]MCZ8537252.1 glycosyltransferase family 4 protein [Paenisporosarcina quisquiliarum]